MVSEGVQVPLVKLQRRHHQAWAEADLVADRRHSGLAGQPSVVLLLGETSVLNVMILLYLARLFNMLCLYS